MGLYMRTGGFDRSGVLGPNPPEPARCPPLHISDSIKCRALFPVAV
ncbi:hypothetical protein MtrunA17_Chr1g0210331 [Medicago truncatula]|uniref:Uncharacterized protein n=1 Tax=Medicago truncatula TaxID=3880 RepID=A0A396JVW6_MEDTR|nr:hypothetical protein MtrunA17_Chr1g0210331 [Medicago truncatula]